MAEQSSGEKSEKPTAGKLRKAREKGEIPRSKDVTMAAGLVASLFTITSFFPYYGKLIEESFHTIAKMAGKLDDTEAMAQFLMANVMIIIKFIATLLPIPATCFVASLVPGGWLFTPTKLIPDFKKLSPISGVKRLFSASHLTDVIKMLLKCGILIYLLYVMVQSSIGDMMQLQGLFLNDAIKKGFQEYYSIMIYFVITIALFAFIDIPLSKHLFTKKMKMTKQEIKDEYKNSEGKPEVKNRIRQLQRQFAMGQINKTVPKADVIITNPTHFAVALKYEPEKASAPYVVAKGIDEVALYIREVARTNQIEIVELPPLARAIYHTTRVNQQVPAQLYRAIAYILTYVLQLKSWRAGKADKPKLNTGISIPNEVLKQYE
ncbi:Flagellar biosynthetic protein flhB [Pragia fontium]|uniref:Flagellar biosynthetic protein FlhB n=1 Tax=Pragia fontium TaxID=82985 RepID=A0ABQ5LIX9_9GAMM|nr:flagellar biosynthesis protein FlhB [Pragia fontium]AKJ41365.1 flagellar biosynthesis protein FlhB [Pragia fontium]GKX62921.1 flagellar biosynthesis protein FlhB [Pragia fontium]SUB81612.1 Flagellar biosynthetic protein flhB [Pragia fontium]